jgi:hypothetical protein
MEAKNDGGGMCRNVNDDDNKVMRLSVKIEFIMLEDVNSFPDFLHSHSH